ncbi:regulatory protein, gntR family [Sinosporangium album]|uniref:Regulatory protein, gntR family n=1 Tax=Sinosporangium album TaxID=504805 RepID=A0A1G8HER4_9ACTN|nr:GntR family transcriptional regulator [Sinosporangium album]SDI05177.1 regulatory protein, gntR family [Sinosporangium album]
MPLPQQIAACLRADIHNGTLLPGQPLPSELRLAQQHGVCRHTVRCAIALLREQGTIYTIRAEGSYVGPRTAPKLRPPLKYEEIADDLRRQIHDGRLPTGRRLPNETTLATRYAVARDTIRAAINLLRDSRHVHTLPRRGTFITH